MGQAEFPDFVRKLPEADLPISDIRGYLLQGDFGQVLFLECDTEVSMPEHSHGNQWGVVVDGEVELTIGSQTRRYNRGDNYFISAGTNHKARLFPGFKAIDYFADKERYKPRSRGAVKPRTSGPVPEIQNVRKKSASRGLAEGKQYESEKD